MLPEHKTKEKLIDIFVGKKLRSARNMMNLSQRELGEAVGLSFQQIQKFETGEIRIGAGRLKQLAEALRIPVQFFFDGVEEKYTHQENVETKEAHKSTEAKSTFINLIANASDDDVKILSDILQRFSNVTDHAASPLRKSKI